MNAFFDNAHRIFDVAKAACASDPADTDFALLVRPDGGLHVVMESPLSLEGAAIHGGARTAYRVTRFGGAVRITGRDGTQTCVLEDAPQGRSGPGAGFLRDRPLYTLDT